MSYKTKTNLSLAFDTSAPNASLDAFIDFIANRIKSDVPEIATQYELSYDADAYKNFPVFSGTNYSGSYTPISKLVFLGKNSNSLGIWIFGFTANSKYYITICVMPSYDMLCVTPATYGDNYKSNTTACAYMAGLLRGIFNCEMRLSVDVTPGDSGNSEVSIIAAGGQYGYVYMISSNRTTDDHFQIGFIRQDTSDKNLLSMWWCNHTPGIFNIDYKYPLKAGIFSPLKYNNIDSYDLPNSTFNDLDQDDPSWKRLILIGYNSNIANRKTGLTRFLLDKYTSTGVDNYIQNPGYLYLPYNVPAQQGTVRRGSYDINTTEYLPFVKTSQIYLQQMPQPLLDETTHIYIYRTALNSPTAPGAGNVYKTSVGAFMLLYPGVLTYSVKLTD